MWKDVQREPVIREYNPQEEAPTLIADLFCHGVYDRQGGASFDICVSDTDAISYQKKIPMSVLHSADVEKKTKYSDACQERHMSFTPLVVSVDGMLAPEFASFLRTIGKALSTKWEKPYSKTMNWVKCRLSFAVLRVSSVVQGKVFRCLFTVVILCFYLQTSHILRNNKQMVSKF